MTEKVVTRFAPSPTGFLHIGGIRTALYAWLYARQNNGLFILRIEDTDKTREVAGSIQQIQDSLKWLGLDWDYGPDKPGPFVSCLQSDRLDVYKLYAEKLVAKGLAYPDPHTESEIEEFKAQAVKEKKPFLFRNHRPAKFAEWDGKRPLRFKVPEIKRSVWQDVVRGELTAGEEMLDDMIIIKSDGYPTYNFAHIVDDHEMGVTHVMRGQEFIASTPKFLSLYQALEIPLPVFVTLPPIMGPDGKKKLSKRDGAKDLLEYRDEGYLPETMRNFLALIGWNPGGEKEIFHDDELIKIFSLNKIQKSGGAFNEEKLRWMNKQFLKSKSEDFKFDYLKTSVPENIFQLSNYSDERLKRLQPVIFERIHNQTEIKQTFTDGSYNWVFNDEDFIAPKALLPWKKDDSPNAFLPRLEKSIEILNTADFTSSETIKEALWPYAEEIGKGELLWPLRIALTGLEQSPDPFVCAYILGKEATIRRLSAAVANYDN